MNLIFEMLIGFLLAFILFKLFNYFIIKLPERRRKLIATEIVKLAVNKTLVKLNQNDMVTITQSQLNDSMVADAWGKGMLVFEFVIPENNINIEMEEFKIMLDDGLSEYSATSLMNIGSQSIFKVTDTWQREGLIHFDVAYLNNRKTIEYVEDLNKLK